MIIWKLYKSDNKQKISSILAQNATEVFAAQDVYRRDLTAQTWGRHVENIYLQVFVQ